MLSAAGRIECQRPRTCQPLVRQPTFLGIVLEMDLGIGAPSRRSTRKEDNVADHRKALQDAWERHRHTNFGNVLVGLDVKGFRAHTETSIEILSPVCAIVGPNGSGKTTLLHLAAAGYKAPPGAASTDYKLSQFFAIGNLDHTPFRPDCKVTLRYSRNDQGGQRPVNLTRREQSQRWSDYKKRDPRVVDFIGVKEFLPRVETNEFVFRKAAKLTVGNAVPLLQEISSNIAEILGRSYASINETSVTHGRMQQSVICAESGTSLYSENNMGFGERKVHKLVQRLEALPNRATILIEEPEIALHYAAQYRLGVYLCKYALRKKSQILLTTHSERLIDALPQKSRIYLFPSQNGVRVLPGLSATQAGDLLGEGHSVQTKVIVEDDVAAAIVGEIVRRVEPALLKTLKVVVAGYNDGNGRVAGGESQIRTAMKVLREAGSKICAVLDADMADDVGNFIYKLPGALPPEKELMNTVAVRQCLLDQYSDLSDDNINTCCTGDHHGWLDRIADAVSSDRAVVLHAVAKAYASALPVNDAQIIVSLLKEVGDQR